MANQSQYQPGGFMAPPTGRIDHPYAQSSPQYPPPSSQPPSGNGNPYQMQSPNYAAPQPQEVPEKAANGRTDQMLAPKPKWNDLIFALLFVAQFLGFIAVAVIALRALSLRDTGASLGSSDTGTTLDTATAYLFSFIAAAGFLLSILFLVIVRAFTKIIIEITLFLSVAVSVGYAVYLWYEKYWSGAIIFTIFAVLAVVSYFFMRKRIPFSVAVLQTVMDVAKHYKSTYIIALLGCALQTVYAVFWSFVMAASYQKWQPNASGSDLGGGSGKGSLIAVSIFLVFSFYWTSQVLTNVLLCAEAGIFGAWYFSVTRLPGHPALGALKRALTYCFGSVCLGSLIVALLDLIRAALNILKTQEGQQGDTIGYIFFCIAECCLGCIQWMVEYFNRYAYIEIALFGKAYVPAAKDAWHLLKDRGIDALVNDCLVNNIWTFGSYAVGALCSLFAFLYIKIADPGFAQDGSSIYAVILLYAFLIGFFIAHSLGYSSLSAGVSTVFVGLAEEPQALQQKSPALFDVIARTYPHVLQRV